MLYDEFNLPPLKSIKEPVCKKCNDTGIVKEEKGGVHVCFDCLNAGRLDVHTKDLKGSKIKI